MVMAKMALVAEEERSTAVLAIQNGFKQTEVGLIPQDWSVAKLGDIGECIIGLTYKPNDVHDDGILVLRSSNIQNERLSFHDNVYVKSFIPDRLMVKPNNVLICVRNGSRDLIGKCILLDHRASGMTFGAFMTVYKSAASRYLYQQFRSHKLKKQINEHLGATINQITNKSLGSFLVALPPTEAEQEAIAEALSDADALIEGLEQLIAKKRSIKQGAMQALLTGKRRLPGFRGQWKQIPLERAGEVKNGLTYSPSDVRETGILVLRSSNIQNDTLEFENNVFVQMNVPEQSRVQENDILICVRNGSRDLIGKAAKIDARCLGMAFGAFMVVFRTNLHDYILHQFRSDIVKKQISEHLGATINQITNKSLKSFVVNMPPTEEEALAISNILSEMDDEITALEDRLAKARAIKQGMMQELLTGRVRLV